MKKAFPAPSDGARLEPIAGSFTRPLTAKHAPPCALQEHWSYFAPFTSVFIPLIGKCVLPFERASDNSRASASRKSGCRFVWKI